MSDGGDEKAIKGGTENVIKLWQHYYLSLIDDAMKGAGKTDALINADCRVPADQINR